MAHNNKLEFEAAAHFFVNALTLTPDATHIWNYLRSSMVRMDRYDLIEKIQMKDLAFFQKTFGPAIDVKNMAKPNMEGVYDNPIWNK